MAARAGKARGEAPDKRTPIKDVLGFAGSAASAVSTVILVLSVTYEWAYFYVVGQKFRNIASFTDYLINALDWLPLAIVAGSIYCIFVVLLAMLFGLTDRKNKKATESYSHALKLALATDQYKQTVLWCGLIVIVIFGGFGLYLCCSGDPATDLLGIAAIFLFVWLSIVSIAITRSENPIWLGTAMKAVIASIPPLFVGVFLWGMQHGYRDLDRPGEPYSLARKDMPKPEEVNVLRIFDRGVLIRLPEQQSNEFVRWDQIGSLSLTREGQAGKPLSCRQFKWGC